MGLQSLIDKNIFEDPEQPFELPLNLPMQWKRKPGRPQSTQPEGNLDDYDWVMEDSILIDRPWANDNSDPCNVNDPRNSGTSFDQHSFYEICNFGKRTQRTTGSKTGGTETPTAAPYGESDPFVPSPAPTSMIAQKPPPPLGLYSSRTACPKCDQTQDIHTGSN